VEGGELIAVFLDNEVKGRSSDDSTFFPPGKTSQERE
jgi:hypothetical protein